MKPVESIKEQIDLLNAFGIKLPDNFEFYPSISFIKQKTVWLKPKAVCVGSPRQAPIGRWEYLTRVRMLDEIRKALYHSSLLNSFLLLQYVTRNTYDPNRHNPDFMYTVGYSFTDMFALRTIKEKVFFFQMSSLFPKLFLMSYIPNLETMFAQERAREMFFKRKDDIKISSETLFQEWIRFVKSHLFAPYGNFNQIYCSLVKMEIDNVTKQKTFLEC